DRRVDVARQVGQRRGDAVAHVLRGGVDVAVEREGHDHDRGALAGDRSQLADALDGVDGFLEGDPDLGLHLLGRGTRQLGPHHHRRQVDRRETVDAELPVAGGADDHQRQDDHRGEDGTANADRGQLLHGIVPYEAGAPAGAISTAAPVVRLPGFTTTDSPCSRPDRISTASPAWRPVVTGRSSALPSRTVTTFSIPANSTSADAGTTRESPPLSVWISARANEPGRSSPFELSTSASTINERFASSIAGEIRTILPGQASVAPSVRTATGWPSRTLSASRSGTSSRRRSGVSLTSVSTGAPAARYSPRLARRCCTAPEKGATSRLSVSCCSTSARSLRRSARMPRRLFTSSSESLYRLSATLKAAWLVSYSACARMPWSRSSRLRSSVTLAWSSLAFAWRTTPTPS